jgi:predicted dehydrogenase
MASATVRRPLDMPVLRCAIIGLGEMGRTHANVLRRHPYFTLAAIASRQPEKQKFAEEYGCQWFASGREMIQNKALDVVVVATPHWQHADMAVAAFRAGLHVVCEKPLAVTASQADAVLRAAEAAKRVLAVVFQTRFEPIYQQAKSLLASGELGTIIRCDMVETFWRSSVYYKSAAWRATWEGEGGGVLLNQAPHVLDRYIWLCGMPESVTGLCDTVLHAIEVEDTASAVFRHAGGCHGHLHVNTTECPLFSGTVIACDRGRLTIHNGSLRVERLRDSIRSRTAMTTNSFGDIENQIEDFRGKLVNSAPELLVRMYENVALAIAGRQPLRVPASEAAKSVELANAIILSSATGRTVSVPMDRAMYDAFIVPKVGCAWMADSLSV